MRVLRKAAAAAALAALTAPLLVAPAAHAVAGLQRVYGATASVFTTSHTLTLTCPVGKVAIGAAASVLGSAIDVHVIGLWPEGGKATVVASSDRNPSTAAWALQGMAICATPAADFQTVVSPLVADGATSAQCPAGKVVIGMGARVSFGRLLYAIPFGPGNGAQGLTSVMAASARQVAFIPTLVQTVAICANSSRASRLAKAQVSGTGAVHVTTVTCPAGTQLHALGGYNHYPNQSQPASFALFSSFASPPAQPNMATVISREVVDNIPAQTWGLDVWAVCAP